ncbi:hypothetical protein JCM24511_03829 [Saitozyma sp. JCM 24511]|nr:hypothetical protein JCM24511_03829 [Saitozyma sp. JCM 24511]
MDEAADLALLDQHLLKTNLLSQRMTGILGQLDTRLSRLDKTIAPLGLQPLTRKAANIDAVLASLSRPGPYRSVSASNPTSSSTPSAVPGTKPNVQGYSLAPTLTPIASVPGSGAATPADETAILTRGPDIMALGEFFGAMDAVTGDLERMWKGFKEGRGGAREAGVRDLSALVEVGFSGIAQLFLKIAREGMGRTYEIDHMLSSGPPTPPNYFPPLPTLLPLTTYTLSLLHPASPRPALPKTESLLAPRYAELISSFADMRGEWMRKSLGVLLGRVEEVDEGGIWEMGRGREKAGGLVALWEGMIVLTEAETLLITTLFPSHPPASLLPQSLSSPLSLLSTAFNPTISTIKRSVSTHAFLAIELYASLQTMSARWEATLTKCLSMTRTPPTGSEVRDMLTALSGTVTTIRGLAMRSFPEFLVDIRTASGGNGNGTGNGNGNGNGGGERGPSAGISDTTHSTLTYLETLPAFEVTVETLLQSSQSQRSWLMGASEAPSPVRSAAEEGGVVKLFVADILGTLIIYLKQRASTMKRVIGQTFLLNNLSHIRNTTAGFNSDIIGPGAEDMLNKAFREAKSAYLSEWTSLIGLLTPPTPSGGRFSGGGGGDRQSLKDGATAFFDRLAELEGVGSGYPLSRQDPDLRDRIGREVEELVGRGYGGFWGRVQGRGVEKCKGRGEGARGGEERMGTGAEVHEEEELGPRPYGQCGEPGEDRIFAAADLRGTPEDVQRRVGAIFR